jgi:hypothetical protein
VTRTLVGTPDLDPQPAEPELPVELLDLSRSLDSLRDRLGQLDAVLSEASP